MKKIMLLFIMLAVAGCALSNLKFGPQSTTKIGTVHYEARTTDGTAMSGSVNLDKLKELADGGAEINIDNLEYLKIKGNYFESDGIGRCPSLLVVFDGKYVVDADNATEFFTDINIYSGNSWFGDLFDKGLEEDKAFVPIVSDNATD